MSNKKPSCLIVCSASPQGVSAQSFIHSFTLTHSAFNVYIVTPEGKPIEFVRIDDNSRRWLNEFKSKPFSVPGKLEDVEPLRYSALLIPSGIGCLYDLAEHRDLAKIINLFIEDKKPICAVGHGIGALCGVKGKDKTSWAFTGYSITGPSLFEVSLLESFSELPIIIEDFVKENDATFSCSKNDCMHVVIDRHIITGQNDMSTLSAVQNLILLCNARQGKSK
ncbi:glutamine amidotransferase-like class 1 domain-containing protein 1 [Hydractinia symbiolongicarpus]|uniref:glutamine amidotransferase-like class 1 domain-containing protein 1 n=1 Tax=Hydractinia symbiolongicarpus TaxID=13093 RepID=UPI00254DC5DD|nr:glutamine amidotransferase-like class 1 domain-containing protein 1 [Hydractinia symbiolongicarpus]